MVPDIFGDSFGIQKIQKILKKQTDLEDLEESRSLKLPVDRSFQAMFSRSNEDGASIKMNSSFDQEAENIGLQRKDIAKYVTKQQISDREVRAAWRDAQ